MWPRRAARVRRRRVPPADPARVVRAGPDRAAAAQRVLVLPVQRRDALPARDAPARRAVGRDVPRPLHAPGDDRADRRRRLRLRTRTVRLARGARRSRRSAVATVPWLAQLGSIAYNEGGLLLFGTLAMGWAFDAALRPARRLGRFPVAGLLAGFACGSKLTGVPEVLLAVGRFVGTRASCSTTAEAAVAQRGTSGARDSNRGIRGEDIRGSASLAHPAWSREQRSPSRCASRASRRSSSRACSRSPRGSSATRSGPATPSSPKPHDVLGQAHFSDAQVERWQQAHSPRPDQRYPAARAQGVVDRRLDQLAVRLRPAPPRPRRRVHRVPPRAPLAPGGTFRRS